MGVVDRTVPPDVRPPGRDREGGANGVDLAPPTGPLGGEGSGRSDPLLDPRPGERGDRTGGPGSGSAVSALSAEEALDLARQALEVGRVWLAQARPVAVVRLVPVGVELVGFVVGVVLQVTDVGGDLVIGGDQLVHLSFVGCRGQLQLEGVG